MTDQQKQRILELVASFPPFSVRDNANDITGDTFYGDIGISFDADEFPNIPRIAKSLAEIDFILHGEHEDLTPGGYAAIKVGRDDN